MTDENIHEMPQPLGNFAGELYRRATQYHKASDSLSPDDDELAFPAYFMLAHSIELMLKSYLASQGTSKKEIRSFGHNITDLYAACLLKELSHEWQMEALVGQFAMMNSDHDFRYPSGYQTLMPTVAHCSEILTRFSTGIKPIIDKAATSANLKFASETRNLIGKKVRWCD